MIQRGVDGVALPGIASATRGDVINGYRLQQAIRDSALGRGPSSGRLLVGCPTGDDGYWFSNGLFACRVPNQWRMVLAPAIPDKLSPGLSQSIAEKVESRTEFMFKDGKFHSRVPPLTELIPGGPWYDASFTDFCVDTESYNEFDNLHCRLVRVMTDAHHVVPALVDVELTSLLAYRPSGLKAARFFDLGWILRVTSGPRTNIDLYVMSTYSANSYGKHLLPHEDMLNTLLQE